MNEEATGPVNKLRSDSCSEGPKSSLVLSTMGTGKPRLTTR